MKTFRLITLFAVLLAVGLILGGCSTTKYMSHTGKSLTRPSQVATTHTVENVGNKPFFVGKKGGPRSEVLPRGDIGISFESQEKMELEFTWFDDLGQVGEKMIEFRAPYTGLYNEHILVDEAFLWNIICLPVIVTNEGNEALIYKDTCFIGEPVVIPAFGYYWTKAPKGLKYTGFWWPAQNQTQATAQCVSTVIPQVADKIFMGQRYARGIHIMAPRYVW